LAEMIANGNTSGPVYLNALKKVNTISQALADAKKELSNLQIQTAQNPASPSSEYQIAQMRIDTLNVQQSVLSKKLSQLYQQIVNLEGQDTQAIAQSLFTQTSVALAEAKRDLADLENQLDYDRLASDLDIKIAQDKVTNFSNRLQVLTQQLGTLVGSNIDSLVTDYLVAGNPSYPSPVLPVRAKAKDTLMMGAVAGIIIAWVLLNLKWIIRQLSSLGASDSNHDETE